MYPDRDNPSAFASFLTASVRSGRNVIVTCRFIRELSPFFRRAPHAFTIRFPSSIVVLPMKNNGTHLGTLMAQQNQRASGLRLVIENAPATQRTITSRRDGRQFQVREQRAAVFRPGEQYPDKFLLTIWDESQLPYEAGEYIWDVQSDIRMGRYGPELARDFTLRPYKAQPAAAVA